MRNVERRATSVAEMEKLGAELVRLWHAGDVVLLDGPLGAGKTTLVRGALVALGVIEPVRSPTYNLLQEFDTSPPVVHIDLFRVSSTTGLGIDDYLTTHLVLIEWPDRTAGQFDEDRCWRISIQPDGDQRLVKIQPPPNFESSLALSP